MKNIKELRELEISKLNVNSEQTRKQLVEEIAKLSRSGKKNSNATKRLRKDIAQMETVINEKVGDSLEGK